MAKKRILVIEDSDKISKLLSIQLRKLGFLINTADDGDEGLEIAIKLIPDLIIIDLMLPSLQGEEVCRTIREGNIMTSELTVFQSSCCRQKV